MPEPKADSEYVRMMKEIFVEHYNDRIRTAGSLARPWETLPVHERAALDWSLTRCIDKVVEDMY